MEYKENKRNDLRKEFCFVGATPKSISKHGAIKQSYNYKEQTVRMLNCLRFRKRISKSAARSNAQCTKLIVTF